MQYHIELMNIGDEVGDLIYRIMDRATGEQLVENILRAIPVRGVGEASGNIGFMSENDWGLMLQAAAVGVPGVVTISFTIYVGAAPSRLRETLVGALAGASVGLVIGGVTTRKYRYAVAGVVIGGAVGALAALTIRARLRTFQEALDDMPLLYPE